jgi:hypothetical protein
MLISGNTVVVIGCSYERGGSEIGLFEIADDGRLGYRATYHLRSNEYYSSRNYASRLIGGCRASCVDWYGNARPLCLPGRVFALLGYELWSQRTDLHPQLRPVQLQWKRRPSANGAQLRSSDSAPDAVNYVAN